MLFVTHCSTHCRVVIPGIAIPSFHHSQGLQPKPNAKLNPNPSVCRPCEW